ncbi:type 11 methyltransferase [Halovivax asiaticus JCM 14624]|uniref:Type 11 methyltransferase n=1 Tax=Halovivax asiaticus JCM 14624 TaxID=1227490 RepID=M0BBK6_9EURY|nr:class I SAM-dependent methyltransferase [Halovivax asiaticus]ELZ08205.1 type 11 methyltransferase [Halovivax asiaticus JCM 14624]
MASDRTETDELDHPLFSRLYRVFDPIDRRTLGAQRRELARELMGRVVDVGAGDGAMFPFVVEAVGAGQAGPARESVTGADAPAAPVEYHAVEPDRTMRRRARSRATELGLPVEFHDARAETLPFADDSVDVVISSLVFCSIAEPGVALDEVARVLRPDGEFRFLEHVGGTGYYRRLQEVLTPVWKRVAGGCHLDRDTVDRFDADDRFELTEFVRTDARLYPAAPIVRGTLRRVDGG